MTELNSNLHAKHSTPAKIAEMLDQTNWGQDFSWSQLSVLAQYFQDYAITAGDVLFLEGDPGISMGLIFKGIIGIYKQDKLIAEISAGRTYGEMALIDNEPRSATAVAHTDCYLLLIDKQQFSKMADHHPKLAYLFLWKITVFLSQNLRKTSGHLSDFL